MLKNPASVVVALKASQRSLEATPLVFPSAAALPDGLFEHPEVAFAIALKA